MNRKLFLTGLLVMSLAGHVAAQETASSASKQQLAQQGYLTCLRSDHEGVRNSTIFRVMQYAALFPKDDLSPFLQELREISLNDPSPRNRLYAVVAYTILENVELRKEMEAPPRNEEEKEAYFGRLHEFLQNHQMVAKR